MTNKSQKPKLPEDPLVRELDAIKRLLIVSLAKAGASQKEIATALQIDPATLSRMIPWKQFQSNS